MKYKQISLLKISAKMDNQNKINSSKAPEPVGLYPHARKVGNLLFLSGVGPRERGTKKIPGVELDANNNIISYDIEAQCRAVFQNIRYILEDRSEERRVGKEI